MTLSLALILPVANTAFEKIAHANPLAAGTYFTDDIFLQIKNLSAKGRIPAIKALQEFSPVKLASGLSAIEIAREKVNGFTNLGEPESPTPLTLTSVNFTWKKRGEKANNTGILQVVYEPLLNMAFINHLHFL